MRTDQYIGLHKWAEEWISVNAEMARQITLLVHFNGDTEVVSSFTIPQVTTIGVIEGAWGGEVANLNRYLLKNGDFVDEYVQAQLWSSGPMYFIALKNCNGDVIEESLWTDQEMEAA